MTLGGVPSREFQPRESSGPAPASVGREGTPVLTLVTEDQSTPAAPVAGGALIDEIVRDGARRMLAAAVEAEGPAYIAAPVVQLDGRGRGPVGRHGDAH